MLLFLLTLFSIFRLIHHTTGLPAGPPSNNADGSILLPSAESANISAFYAPLIFHDDDMATTQRLSTPARPSENHIWPEVAAAQYYIKFKHYGQDFSSIEGKALLSKAQEEVEGWIKSSKKGSYTPVDAEHHWSEGRSFLTIKPEHDGYLLGDLDKYLASMVAFHTSESMCPKRFIHDDKLLTPSETPSHRPRNDYIATAIPTNPITPAAAAAKGTLDAAANPVDDEAGTPLVPVIPVASALLVVAPLPAIVPFPLMTTDVLPFTTVANRLVVNVLPILVIVLTNVAFPVPLFNNVLVGFTVAALASLLIMLNVDSTTLSRLWYSVGRAVRNGGGVSAVSAEETMEFMFPVMEAEEAADSIATARPGRMDWGKYWDIIWAAAEERAGAEVLWSKERELVLDERGGKQRIGLTVSSH
ncbi:MAG: hypothetical protein Q9196_004330 [Gyalolechia fulgens]